MEMLGKALRSPCWKKKKNNQQLQDYSHSSNTDSLKLSVNHKRKDQKNAKLRLLKSMRNDANKKNNLNAGLEHCSTGILEN